MDHSGYAPSLHQVSVGLIAATATLINICRKLIFELMITEKNIDVIRIRSSGMHTAHFSGWGGGLCLWVWGVCLWIQRGVSTTSPVHQPPVDRQTSVKMLPCPQLCLRSVIRFITL